MCLISNIQCFIGYDCNILLCAYPALNVIYLSFCLIFSEMLAWASAQIHCQFHGSESRVALPTQGTKQDVQAENDTVLIPSRGGSHTKLKSLLFPVLRG